MKASGGWLAAFSCLLAGSHGRAPADADSLASPTDPCSVANDPRCDAFMADPCGAMNHAKYAEFVKASDGTKASFFRQVDAATKGYISAPRDFYHCERPATKARRSAGRGYRRSAPVSSTAARGLAATETA